MGVHDGHRARMKEKFLAYGLETFADHEALEMVLYYAIPRRNTNETAHLLLRRFGSLKDVLSADVRSLEEVPGVGRNAATLLKLLQAVGDRAALPALPKVAIRSGDQVGDYFVRLLDGETKEVLYLMCLDGKGKILSCQVAAKGGVNVTAISVREVVDMALRSGAISAILAHNHPSGIALPSRADCLMTRQVGDTMRPLGIRLLDHIVVADGDYVSMADSGMELS